MTGDDAARLYRVMLRRLVDAMLEGSREGDGIPSDHWEAWHSAAMVTGRTDVPGFDFEAAGAGLKSAADDAAVFLDGERRPAEAPT